MPPTVTFLSDYGLSDHFVGICRGVIARLAEGVRVIDVCHAVPPGDVAAGALLLAQAVEYLPRAVHLAVVDPGVGTLRTGVVVTAADGSELVGPDNGLLLAAVDRLGGPVAAHALTAPGFRLDPVSPTFHGRDLFAPAAAHLATGTEAAALGPAVPTDALIRLSPAPARVETGVAVGEVVWIDRFGNIAMNLGGAVLETLAPRPGDALLVELAGRVATARRWLTFAQAEGGLAVLVDSFGQVSVARDGGSAAAEFRARLRDAVRLRAAPVPVPFEAS